MAACQGSNVTCNGQAIRCHEASDCRTGDVCCADLRVSGAAMRVSTTCAAQCPSMTFQVCRSNTECPQGECIVQRCPMQASAVEACVLLPSCTRL
jgi:hypothetical protein